MNHKFLEFSLACCLYNFKLLLHVLTCLTECMTIIAVAKITFKVITSVINFSYNYDTATFSVKINKKCIGKCIGNSITPNTNLWQFAFTRVCKLDLQRHTYKLYKPNFRLDIRQFSSSLPVISIWNALHTLYCNVTLSILSNATWTCI